MRNRKHDCLKKKVLSQMDERMYDLAQSDDTMLNNIVSITDELGG